MSFEHLKLNKQLELSLQEAGFSSPKEIQEKTISRIAGGQDLIVIAPEKSGKTTTAAMGVVMRLNYAQEEAPRALILVPSKEKGLEALACIELLAKQTDLRIITLFPGAGVSGQKDQLAEGVDIVIGTPDRVLMIYQRSGLNLNKLRMLICDDMDLMIKQGFNTAILQITESSPKCQHLVFSEVVHEKLHRTTDQFMSYPTLIEVFEEPTEKIDTDEQNLYIVPNYKTKLNLLNLLLSYYETSGIYLVITANRDTAEKVYKSVAKRKYEEVGILNPHIEQVGLKELHDLLQADTMKIMVLTWEEALINDLDQFPNIIYFDVPEDRDKYLELVIKKGTESLKRNILLVTELELDRVSKIEQLIGYKIAIEPLLPGLIVEGDPHSRSKASQQVKKAEEGPGPAFHEKKASNSKNYNYSYKDKLKMFGKKKRR